MMHNFCIISSLSILMLIKSFFPIKSLTVASEYDRSSVTNANGERITPSTIDPNPTLLTNACGCKIPFGGLPPFVSSPLSRFRRLLKSNLCTIPVYLAIAIIFSSKSDSSYAQSSLSSNSFSVSKFCFDENKLIDEQIFFHHFSAQLAKKCSRRLNYVFQSNEKNICCSDCSLIKIDKKGKGGRLSKTKND